MSENKIKIMLEMIDNASPEFKKANEKVIAEVKKLEGETEKSFTKNDEAIKKNEKSLLRLTVTIASVIQAFRLLSRGVADVVKVGREMDEDFNQSFNNFELAVLKAEQVLAQKLIPTIQTAIEFWTEFLDNSIQRNDGWNESLNQSVDRVNQLTESLNALDTNYRISEDQKEARKQSLMEEIALERQKITTLQEFARRENETSGFSENLERRKTEQLKKELAQRKALRDADSQNQLAALSFAAEMTNLFGQESKAAFYILKAISAAEILVNSARADMAITAVWAANPPVEAALIAKNKVLTAISLATVAASAIAGSFAEGSASIPDDMVAQIHKKEMIIPATFSESIRRGELTLGGKDGGSFGDINIFIQGGINPGGSSVDEMAEQLGFAFEKEVRLARGF